MRRGWFRARGRVCCVCGTADPVSRRAVAARAARVRAAHVHAAYAARVHAARAHGGARAGASRGAPAGAAWMCSCVTSAAPAACDIGQGSATE